MSVDLDKARANLPLPALLERLGHGAAAKKSARCPFHDDKAASFSVFHGTNGRWQWKCHAGTCGGGDEVDYIAKAEGLDNATAIKRYGELAGANGAPATVADACKIFGGVVKSTEKALLAPKPPAVITPLTPEGVALLAKWRGYSPEFVQEIATAGIVGTFEGHIAFPVAGGVHFRKKDSSWRYSEGASASLFMPWPIASDADVFVFESQWCALAYAYVSHERNAIATRGASNIGPLSEAFAGRKGTIYLFPQNDAPGQKWAREIRNELALESVKLCVVPKEHKDLNDMLRALGKSCELEVDMAIANAKDFPVHAQDDSCGTRPPKQSSTDEAPACAKPSDNAAERDGAVRSQDAGGGEPIGGNDSGLERTTPMLQPVGASSAAPAPISNSDAERTEREPHRAPTDSETENHSAAECHEFTPPALLRHDAPTVGILSSLGDILDSIATYLKKYIIFPVTEQVPVIALWCAHTHVFEAFRFSPYLHVASPEKRCGKTRLLECIQLLVPRPRSFVRPSEAVLFRTIEKERPTLLLDEIDTIFGKDADESAEALRGILNAGFQKGGSVPRCEANGKSFTVVDFSVFSPKIIAGIGKIPDTVRDRSLEIRLVRQTNELKAARFRQVAAEEESTPIREALSAWAKAAANDLARACPELPEQLTDRQADMTEPLIAIADMAGGEWSEKGREAIIALCSVTEDQSPGVQLLKSIREIFAAKDRESLTSTDLINALISVEEANAPWVSWWETDVKRQQMHGPQQKLARMLEPYGIKPQKMGDDFDDNVKGYHRADFADAWQRYLSPITGLITAELPF